MTNDANQSVYVEKRIEYAAAARALAGEIEEILGVGPLNTFRRIIRYDIRGLTQLQVDDAVRSVLADPITDGFTIGPPRVEELNAFAVEYLPGQFDQRADSAAEAIEILTGGIRPDIRVAEVYLLDATLADADIVGITKYLVNEVDSRLCDPFEPPRFPDVGAAPERVPTLRSFFEIPATDEGVRSLGLAMSPADLGVCQRYFRDEAGRPPTETEVRVLDTYWSDHCRHTTFETKLESIRIDRSGAPGDAIRQSHETFLTLRRELLPHDRAASPPTLMELATIVGRWARKKGLLDDLLVSEEINAATVGIEVSTRPAAQGDNSRVSSDHTEADSETEDWYLLFKNETHNHPTEIEPIGGAETCLGGAIRDPLSGRAYVHQAMRITGGADPRVPVAQTIAGKLPQRTITTQAARGFSSYGNQIGLATGVVHEFFHPGYAAKRMEIGAVIGAAPKSQVVHRRPEPGDVVLLIGGRTGRDGCGGATGSSKAHDVSSITEASAEVQKGNPPVERALQRLFRNADFSRRVKRSNDFGAGGVSVAVGEIAESLDIDLDALPVKYLGLGGTELAISESQERMAIVVDPADLEAAITAAGLANLEATVIARVTDSGHLRMHWNGETIVDIERSFLDTNGATRGATVVVEDPPAARVRSGGTSDANTWVDRIKSLDAASRKGLSEIFDSTIGAGTLLAPWGGRYQLTPVPVAAARIPHPTRVSRTASVISYGFFLDASSASPYHGAFWSVVEAVARAVCAGAQRRTIRLSLQEYFPRVGTDPARWGLPYAALLGAMEAQLALETPAIGGKDSMSGTFEDLDVPPTLVAFAFAATDEERITGPEFSPEPKNAGTGMASFEADQEIDGDGGGSDGEIVCLVPDVSESGIPDGATLRRILDLTERAITEGVVGAGTFGEQGLPVALTQAAFGNWCSLNVDPDALATIESKIGIYLQFAHRSPGWLTSDPTATVIGSVCRVDRSTDTPLSADRYGPHGAEAARAQITIGSSSISLEALRDAWFKPLDHLFPLDGTVIDGKVNLPAHTSTKTDNRAARGHRRTSATLVHPQVCIPVFPGTNCEFDSARAFETAGATVITPVFRKRTPDELRRSLSEIASAIQSSQILMFPGGFSAGDEPDGSGKYIAALFQDARLREAIDDLYHRNEGLILGICNGFQALVRMGLLPGGIEKLGSPPTAGLFLNTGLRHISSITATRVVSTLSPWLAGAGTEHTYLVPISHGEGRFIAPNETIVSLARSGQIATQYVECNPNGSLEAIEGICSPDGRILGKMGHNERLRSGLYRNLPPISDMKIFESGVAFFR